MARQWVQVKFRPNDRRAYTYHWDGTPPLKVGDMVKVPGKLPDDGWTALAVTGLQDYAPAFDTKGILALAPPKEGEQTKLGLDDAAAEAPDRNKPSSLFDKTGPDAGGDPAAQ